MVEKLNEIWERMNDSEKFGCQFALFPVWVSEYKLTTEETVELMKEMKPNINEIVNGRQNKK